MSDANEHLTPRLPTIEVGWIIAGSLDEPDAAAVRAARSAVLKLLNETFSDFSWQMPVIRRSELTQAHREESVVLLEAGVTERNSNRLDFGLVITSADLVGHYKPFALAAVSRSLDLTVISTSRIDPQAADNDLSRDDRVKLMAERLQTLVLHTLGHLCGLIHAEQRGNLMFDLQTVDDLAAMQSFDPPQITLMQQNLSQIADLRLEEQPTERRSTVRFYLDSAWLNWHEIRDAVWQARPWEFPTRLSRLSAAAISAAMVLIMTAEMWDMATSLSFTTITVLAAAVLAVTTLFIVNRQQLLVRRQERLLSEQTVVTNVSSTAIVFCGMLTTVMLLFTLLLVSAMLLFSKNLAGAWSTSLEESFSTAHYFKLAATAGSLSALIGALGASFEDQHHFRHITLIDEET